MPGFFTPGLPLVGSTSYPILSGTERLPLDTNVNDPASLAVTPFQLAAYAAAIIENLATATAGAATLSAQNGIVNTGSVTTAAGATYTLTLTNTLLTVNTPLVAQVYDGTNTGGLPQVTSITVSAGSAVIVVTNAGTTAFNGTLLIAFGQA